MYSHFLYFCTVHLVLLSCYFLTPSNTNTNCKYTSTMSFLNIDNQYLELCPDLELNSCDYVEPDDLPMLSNICKNDLSVMQLNVRGLLNKQYLMKEILLTTKPDVVLLCETWLTAHTETLLDIPGYKCSHKIRKDRIGGGVSV